MNTRTPVITATDLVRTYPGKSKKESFTAVRGTNFDVLEGEVFGLLGTNGAGKTTTLEVLEGLAAPTSGTVEVLGMDPIKDRAQLRRHTGIMLQSGGLPSQLSVQETIGMWAGQCSAPLPTGHVLDAVGLDHRTRVKVGALSGGEQRRLDLACALVGDPDVIFLDEPTTGLDPESRRNVWRLLTDLKERGVTMILTTHYLEEAERLCDRIAIMHEGAIALEGTLGELVGTASAEISFRVPPASRANGADRADGRAPGEPSGLAVPTYPDFPELPGAQVTRERSSVRISTDHLQRDTLAVLSWAHTHDLDLEDFSARPATLETVFLSIAGHHER